MEWFTAASFAVSVSSAVLIGFVFGVLLRGLKVEVEADGDGWFIKAIPWGITVEVTDKSNGTIERFERTDWRFGFRRQV